MVNMTPAPMCSEPWPQNVVLVVINLKKAVTDDDAKLAKPQPTPAHNSCGEDLRVKPVCMEL